MAKDWRSEVYYQEKTEYPENWDKIRNAILWRDRFYCLRCDKKFKKTELSVHHIMPRDKGGTEEYRNLITLCHPCHDHVEINELRSRAAIIGSCEDQEVVVERKERNTVKHKGESFERPKWHARVYGGVR